MRPSLQAACTSLRLVREGLSSTASARAARVLVLCALGLAGCASVPRSVSQSIEIEAVTPLGATVADARCRLSQGAAEWDVVPPARTTVMTSDAELLVRCEAGAGAARGEARVPAKVQGGRGRQALIGAGIGALVGLAIGAVDDSTSRDSNSMCCSGLGKAVGPVLGLGIGAASGAIAADPSFVYPAKVRVMVEPGVPRATGP